MKRRDFLLTSAASVATVLVPLPALTKTVTFAKGGVVIGSGTLPMGWPTVINCRCVISPELAGRMARHTLNATLDTVFHSEKENRNDRNIPERG